MHAIIERDAMAATPKTDPALPVVVDVLAEMDGMTGLLAAVREEAELEQVSGLEAGLRRDAGRLIAGLASRGYVIVQADDGK